MLNALLKLVAPVGSIVHQEAIREVCNLVGDTLFVHPVEAPVAPFSLFLRFPDRPGEDVEGRGTGRHPQKNQR